MVAGIASVALEVRAANEGAQLFYKRMGYRTLTQLPGYYQGIEDALRMERFLSCRSGSQNSVGTLLNLAKLLGPDFYHQTLFPNALRSQEENSVVENLILNDFKLHCGHRRNGLAMAKGLFRVLPTLYLSTLTLSS